MALPNQQSAPATLDLPALPPVSKKMTQFGGFTSGEFDF